MYLFYWDTKRNRKKKPVVFGPTNVKLNLVRYRPCQDLLHEVNRKKYIVTAICYFSKYVKAKAIGSKNVTEIADFLFGLICQYGIFWQVHSNQGYYHKLLNLTSSETMHHKGFAVSFKFCIVSCYLYQFNVYLAYYHSINNV